MNIRQIFACYYITISYYKNADYTFEDHQKAYSNFVQKLNQYFFAIGYRNEHFLINFVRDYMQVFSSSDLIYFHDMQLLDEVYQSDKMNYTYYLYWIQRFRLRYSDIFNLFIAFRTLRKYIKKKKITMRKLLEKYMFRDVSGIICKYVNEPKYHVDKFVVICSSSCTPRWNSDEIPKPNPARSLNEIDVRYIATRKLYAKTKHLDVIKGVISIKLNPETKDTLLDIDRKKCYCLDTNIPDQDFGDECYFCHRKISWFETSKWHRNSYLDKTGKKIHIENRLIYDMTNKEMICFIRPVKIA